jgi:hypothetical protein
VFWIRIRWIRRILGLPNLDTREGWAAKSLEGWAAMFSEGWAAKSVARQLATAVLWVRIQTSLKNHKWAT